MILTERMQACGLCEIEVVDHGVQKRIEIDSDIRGREGRVACRAHMGT